MFSPLVTNLFNLSSIHFLSTWTGELLKRREQSHLQESETIKRRKGEGVNATHVGPDYGIQV